MWILVSIVAAVVVVLAVLYRRARRGGSALSLEDSHRIESAQRETIKKAQQTPGGMIGG